MNTKTIRRYALSRLILAICSSAVLVGCAALPGDGPEDVVRTRAQARWDAVIAGSWEQAYSYTTPTYRDTHDLFKFRAKYDALIKFRKAVFFGIACEDDLVCKVKMKVTFTPPQDIPSPDLTTVIEERWVKDAGAWWRYEDL